MRHASLFLPHFTPKVTVVLAVVKKKNVSFVDKKRVVIPPLVPRKAVIFITESVNYARVSWSFHTGLLFIHRVMNILTYLSIHFILFGFIILFKSFNRLNVAFPNAKCFDVLKSCYNLFQ